jgi:hypothetical protein
LDLKQEIQIHNQTSLTITTNFHKPDTKVVWRNKINNKHCITFTANKTAMVQKQDHKVCTRSRNRAISCPIDGSHPSCDAVHQPLIFIDFFNKEVKPVVKARSLFRLMVIISEKLSGAEYMQTIVIENSSCSSIECSLYLSSICGIFLGPVSTKRGVSGFIWCNQK